jgi:hypothetical protein
MRENLVEEAESACLNRVVRLMAPEGLQGCGSGKEVVR